ncbi:MAG: TRAP transporter large permease subunit [Myxococcales bacterium]|nr:TRAP transporter large permease subunit [Myxococcales bacterium]
MEPLTVLLVIALVLLALLGSPLLAIFAAAAMLLFAGLADTSITGAAADIFSEKFAESPLLVTIPLFTFAGYLMAESGTPQRLVRVSRAWFGWMPGGLAMVCLVASAFFTTFTGGSGITIVAIGGLLYPALISEKYPEQFSLGLVTAGGSLGLLFPPSLPIVLFAVVAGIEVEKLFLAGLVPGVVTVFALALYAAFVGVRFPSIPRQAFDTKEAFASLRAVFWELMLPVLLVGALVAGVLRIHEAAAFTAIYVLIIEVFVYKDVKIRALQGIVKESMTMVGAILAILATAVGFTGYLIQAQVPMEILEWMKGFIESDDPVVRQITFLLLLNVFLLLVGMLMDIFSAIVVVVPLILPIARQLGVNDYHLGVVFLLNLEIGYLTPPVGLNLFISSFRFGKPVTLLYKAVVPFIALLIVALAVTTYWPRLSLLFLPEDAGVNVIAEEPPTLDVEDAPVVDDDGGGGGFGDLDDLFDESGGGGGLDALEDELDGDAPARTGLDALEDELGGADDEEEDDDALDALEGDLGF